jgi:hypothetical protein
MRWEVLGGCAAVKRQWWLVPPGMYNLSLRRTGNLAVFLPRPFWLDYGEVSLPAHIPEECRGCSRRWPTRWPMLVKVLLATVLLRPVWAQGPVSNTESSQALDAKLQTRVVDYRLSTNSFLEALTKVAGEFKIPMGIQWVRNKRTQAPVNLTFKDASLIDIIRQIAQTQPGYTAKISHGVVHVFPQSVMADRRNFLNLRIGKFEVHGDLYPIARSRLFESHRKIVAPRPPQPPGGGVGVSNIGIEVGDPRVTIQLESATVIEALDMLCLKSAENIWVVTFCDDCGLTPAGLLRTTSLYDPKGLFDSPLPFWDTFRWGRRIPSTAFKRE